jgi:hypothetical protein
MTVRGTVINIHTNGATVRLDDGTLAAAKPTDVAASHAAYVRSLDLRDPLDFEIDRLGRYALVWLSNPKNDVPTALRSDERFEAKITAFLKASEETAPPSDPAQALASRHVRRKWRRGGHEHD